jgi:hypothetical protein
MAKYFRLMAEPQAEETQYSTPKQSHRKLRSPDSNSGTLTPTQMHLAQQRPTSPVGAEVLLASSRLSTEPNTHAGDILKSEDDFLYEQEAHDQFPVLSDPIGQIDFTVGEETLPASMLVQPSLVPCRLKSLVTDIQPITVAKDTHQLRAKTPERASSATRRGTSARAGAGHARHSSWGAAPRFKENVPNHDSPTISPKLKIGKSSTRSTTPELFVSRRHESPPENAVFVSAPPSVAQPFPVPTPPFPQQALVPQAQPQLPKQPQPQLQQTQPQSQLQSQLQSLFQSSSLPILSQSNSNSLAQISSLAQLTKPQSVQSTTSSWASPRSKVSASAYSAASQSITHSNHQSLVPDLAAIPSSTPNSSVQPDNTSQLLSSPLLSVAQPPAEISRANSARALAVKKQPDVLGVCVYLQEVEDDSLLGEIIIRPGATNIGHMREMIEEV